MGELVTGCRSLRHGIGGISAKASRERGCIGGIGCKRCPGGMLVGVVVAHGSHGRDTHSLALVVGVNAGAHEIELPTVLGLGLDEGLQGGPCVVGSTLVFLAVGLDADNDLGGVLLALYRRIERLNGLHRGLDERGSAAGCVAGCREIGDVLWFLLEANLFDLGSAVVVKLQEREQDRRGGVAEFSDVAVERLDGGIAAR